MSMMFDWPPNWTLFFGIVAFLAASVAVRSWRELGLLLLLTALLTQPVKWIGTALGLAGFAAPIWTSEVNERGLPSHSFETTPAVVGAFIIAALAIIAFKELRARRAPPA